MQQGSIEIGWKINAVARYGVPGSKKRVCVVPLASDVPDKVGASCKSRIEEGRQSVSRIGLRLFTQLCMPRKREKLVKRRDALYSVVF
jgi:hypothetical protein